MNDRHVGLTLAGLATICLVLFGCVAPGVVLFLSNRPDTWDRGSHTRTIKGHYFSGFEESAFKPCGSDKKWWVDLGSFSEDRFRGFFASVERGSPSAGSYVYVVFQGTYTDIGRYGHLGDYKREFRVNAIEEVRKPSATDCF